MPLNHDAVAVIRDQLGKHDSRVFTYEGEPVSRAKNHAWRKALKRADISDFRWHDLRHTWASWHIQNGTPIHVLQELGGVGRFFNGHEVRPLVQRTPTNLRRKCKSCDKFTTYVKKQ